MNDLDWMDDIEAKENFEKGLLELDDLLKPLTDAIEQSENLNENDWNLTVY